MTPAQYVARCVGESSGGGHSHVCIETRTLPGMPLINGGMASAFIINGPPEIGNIEVSARGHAGPANTLLRAGQ